MRALIHRLRPQPMTGLRLMTTNWAKRAWWWGAAGALWCLLWTAWVLATWDGSWWAWFMLVLFPVMGWFNARNLGANWRAWHAHGVRQASLQERRELFVAMLVERGVPPVIALVVDLLMIEGRFDEADQLIAAALDAA